MKIPLTGIEKIDHQHMDILLLFAQLEEDVNPKIFSTLIEYSHSHFAAEEQLIRSLNYPGFEAHLDAHFYLQQSILEGINQILTDPTIDGEELMQKLKQQLLHPISTYDAQLASHVKG